METALYYLLSTIAQTFGGAAALLGALVLFRMQSLSEQARRAADHLREAFRHSDNSEIKKMDEIWLSGDFEALIEQSRRSADASTAQYANTRAILAALVGSAETLRRRFLHALWITAVLVMVSIATIPIVSTQTFTSGWPAGLFVVSFLAFVLTSLILYGRALLSAIGRPLSPK